MQVSFQSPVDGFLTIYLVDSESKAYCLLPYRGQTDGAYNINANEINCYDLVNADIVVLDEKAIEVIEGGLK